MSTPEYVTASEDHAECSIGWRTFRVDRTDVPDPFGERRVTYKWSIFERSTQIASASDLHTGVDTDHGPVVMLGAFLSFLGAEAESRDGADRRGTATTVDGDPFMFDDRVGAIAQELSDELGLIAYEIEENR